MQNLLLLLLLLCQQGVRRASGVAGAAGGGILSVPSAASLAHCPTRCGDAEFHYPFGTAPGCSGRASSSPATTPRSIALPEYLQGFRFTVSSSRSRRNGVVAQPDADADAEPSINVKVFLTDDYEFDTSDLYSSWVNRSVHTSLEIFATDEPSCEIASANKETYACSSGSICQTGKWGGYFCYCNPHVSGNPYVLDGCIEGA